MFWVAMLLSGSLSVWGVRCWPGHQPQPELSEVDESCASSVQGVARQFREEWCGRLQTQTLLPPHPTDHPFFADVGGYWSVLYGEELQALQGGGVGGRQENVWAAISINSISPACLVALTSLVGACLSWGNKGSKSWVQRDLAVSRLGAGEDIFLSSFLSKDATMRC